MNIQAMTPTSTHPPDTYPATRARHGFGWLAAVLAVSVSAGIAAPVQADHHEDDEEWIPLFDGETLEGWRAAENPDSFRVEDGLLIADGPRAHLFYEGEVGDANFTDFELRMEVKTFPNANSGVFFHTEYQESGWPSHGYEVQINATHSDRIKTGSIYGVENVMDDAPHEDEEWFTLHFKVKGDEVVVHVDDEVVNEFTEPEGTEGPRHLSSGTVAIQAHDPDSIIHFRNIEIRLLDE